MKNFHTIVVVVVFGIGVVSCRARYSADVFFARMHTRSVCVRVCCSSPRALALRYAYYLKSLRKTFHSALARGECGVQIYTHCRRRRRRRRGHDMRVEFVLLLLAVVVVVVGALLFVAFGASIILCVLLCKRRRVSASEGVGV